MLFGFRARCCCILKLVFVLSITITSTLSASFHHNRNNHHQPRQAREVQEEVGVMTATSTANHHVDNDNASDNHNNQEDNSSTISIGFLGNSILYYNDAPRLIEYMLKLKSQQWNAVFQDSCLRGGASFITLLEKGNGMAEKFATPNARREEDGSYDIGAPTVPTLLAETTTTAEQSDKPWDYIIMNDYTQAPARNETRNETIKILQEKYLPMIDTNLTTVVFLQTAAYRRHVKNSDDLGNFDEFTRRLYEGYNEYAKHIPNSKVAPVGQAYQYIKNHEKELGYDSSDADDETQTFWYKLYQDDNFHPSPHGTLLEASVIYCTITGKSPPPYDDISWWEKYKPRRMQPPDLSPMSLPTLKGRFLKPYKKGVIMLFLHEIINLKPSIINIVILLILKRLQKNGMMKGVD